MRDLCIAAACVLLCGLCGFVFEVARDDMATSLLRKALMDGSMVVCVFSLLAGVVFGVRAALEA